MRRSSRLLAGMTWMVVLASLGCEGRTHEVGGEGGVTDAKDGRVDVSSPDGTKVDTGSTPDAAPDVPASETGSSPDGSPDSVDAVAPNGDGDVVPDATRDAQEAGTDAPTVGTDAPTVGADAPAADTAGCSATQHQCPGSTACVPLDSTAACGAACAVCTAPAGGTAACASSTCDFSCGALKKCAAAKLCVPATGCCTQADCPAQGGKVGSCDTASHACTYACPANTVSCNGACIPNTGCCTDGDCAGSCQRCGTNHVCGPAVSQNDPNGRCAGTCDAAGACKSKQGQACNATPNGCVAGAPCVDGYCCNDACAGSCMACDVAGKQGTCSAVASGAPHGSRTCSAPAGGTASCAAGACTFSCGTQKKCAAAMICIAPTACCDASECAPMQGKVASCAAATRSCSYACAPGTSLCNSACIPTGAACTTLYMMKSVTEGSQLIRFGATTPGTIDSTKLVTGLPADVYIVTMDFRPATGVLYGFGTNSQLYTINITTGAATAVGVPILPVLEYTPSHYVAAAFIPGVDMLRVWNATGQNMRVNPTTAATIVDTRLPQGFGTGISPRDIAYTDNPVVLYALDALNDTLSTSPNPNAGTVTQVGPLGINLEAAGFGIEPGTMNAYAAVQYDGGGNDFPLYRVNLATGALTNVGQIASPPGLVRAIVVAP